MSASVRTHRIANTLLGCAGVLLFVFAWNFIGTHHLVGRTIPPIRDVANIYRIPYRRALLFHAAATTSTAAAFGLLVGILIGAGTAIFATLFRKLQPGLDNLAIVTNSVPAIALGPILIITAGRELTPVALASISVSFLTYVAIISGIRAGDAKLGNVFTTFGATQVGRLIYLQLPLALPSLVSSLKISVTAAMIGAVVGEWFGAFSGLGIVILNTMQNFQVPLMWAAVLLLSAISSAAYGVFSLLEHVVRKRYA